MRMRSKRDVGRALVLPCGNTGPSCLSHATARNLIHLNRLALGARRTAATGRGSCKTIYQLLCHAGSRLSPTAGSSDGHHLFRFPTSRKDLSVRWILIIALFLFGSAATACLLPMPRDGTVDVPESQWVRTRDGWEPRIGWEPPPPLYEPTVHPIVVASGQILISLIALIAFSTECRSGGCRLCMRPINGPGYFRRLKCYHLFCHGPWMEETHVFERHSLGSLRFDRHDHVGPAGEA